MKTKTINLYPFDELSDPAKQSVLCRYRDINTKDDYWFESAMQEWENVNLLEKGFVKAKVRFTGFYSQRDGASFTWTDVYFSRLASLVSLSVEDNKILREIMNKVHISDRCEASQKCVHENSVRFSVEYCDSERVLNLKEKEFIEAFSKLVEEKRRAVCQDIYQSLRKEYEFFQTDEAVAETFRLNDYHFNPQTGEIEDC